VTTKVRPVARNDGASTRSWRRAVEVGLAVVLVTGSVAAQALNLTPLAIVLLIAGILAAAPLALPSLDL
jgi:hypothetical protein